MTFRIIFRPLFVPTLITSFLLVLLLFLGTWQLERKSWKEGLLLKETLIWKSSPIPWKEAASFFQKYKKIKDFPVRQFELKGHFFKYPVILIPAPVPSFSKKKKELQDRLFSFLRHNKLAFYGYKIIQPFFIEGGDVLWVDRGWIPSLSMKASFERERSTIRIKLEEDSQISFVHRMITPVNKPEQNQWMYFSSQEASRFYNIKTPYNFYGIVTSSLVLKQNFFPIPTVEEKQMRNQHLTYAVIWYSLGAFLVFFYFVFHHQQGRLKFLYLS